MTLALSVVSFLLLISLGFNLFFLSELNKKFGFLNEYVADNEAKVTRYEFEGCEAAGLKKGMYNVALTHDAPFGAKVAFRINLAGLTGVDPYGYMRAVKCEDGKWRATMSTYLGNAPVEFIFITTAEGVKTSCTDEDQQRPVVAVYEPHWWQRLGIGA